MTLTERVIIALVSVAFVSSVGFATYVHWISPCRNKAPDFMGECYTSQQLVERPAGFMCKCKEGE